MIFDIAESDAGDTTVNFTHRGMRPHDESYHEAEQTWRDRLRERLEPLISRGDESAEPDTDSGTDADAAGGEASSRMQQGKQ